MDIKELIEKATPKIPDHIHEEYSEHDWERDEDGSIDEFAMAYDYHNGPRCKRCGYDFCLWCEPHGYENKPCVVDEFYCPTCHRWLSRQSKNCYCIDCGQLINWEESK